MFAIIKRVSWKKTEGGISTHGVTVDITTTTKSLDDAIANVRRVIDKELSMAQECCSDRKFSWSGGVRRATAVICIDDGWYSEKSEYYIREIPKK